MAEPAAGESSGASSAPPLPAAGAEEKERPPGGGARPEAGGAAPDPAPAEKKADPEHSLKPPDVPVGSRRSINSPAAARKRSHKSPNVRKSPLEPCPKKLSPGKEEMLSPLGLSPGQLPPTPQAKRRSWCRSSLKGPKRRKSLPPIHQEVTELSKSISLELPETDRLALLLLASFQFSAQKLEHILKQSDGFSPEAFKAHVESVLGDLEHHVEKLKLDGTLKSCVEPPSGVLLDPALDTSAAEIKEHITRFSAECQAWDQLLLRHQESVEEMSRQLEESRRERPQVEPQDYLQTSQAEVLGSKPNYQEILAGQGEVLSCVELVLNELQQVVKLLQAFSEESHQYLRGLSEQLASRTFRQLETSPVRKLIAAPAGKMPPGKS